MKKLLCLLIVPAFYTSSFSQSFHLGFKGGATINKLTGQSFSDRFSYGYHIGGFAAIGLGKRFAIQPEVLFNQVNVDTSSSFSAVYKFDHIKSVKLKYLSIPVLLNFKANKLLTLQAGPQFGILTNRSKTLLENGKEAFKNGDLAMLGGVELNIMRLKVYGRYTIGLDNINDIDNQEKWKSQAFQIGVGFRL